MDKHQADLEELTRLFYDLLRRVGQLERRLENLSSSGTQARPNTAAPQAKLADQQPIVPKLPPPAILEGGLESRIGSDWLNRVGILAVLVGASFFLKYAFESKWFGPAGRVLIGLLAGIAAIMCSEWFRRHGYRIFSFSLKALGLGVLYLSLWAAFQVYNLVSWIQAFVAMVTVTASATALALWQEAEILALLALLGGFATPVLLYTGESREFQLFSYLALLNLATLILTGSRPWRRLLLVGLFATLILYFAWYAMFYRRSELALTLGFATVFFLTFAIAALVDSVYRPNVLSQSNAVLFVSTLNALAYFLELYLILGRIQKTTTAVCALALAASYALVGGFLDGKVTGDKASALRRLHLALSTVFITLAIAIRFVSHWISIAWFLEAAGLITIGFWRRSFFVRWQGLVLIALSIAKVFVYDIWRLDRGYRIVSFLGLGLLLLVVSFVYQGHWLRQSLGRAAGNHATDGVRARTR